MVEFFEEMRWANAGWYTAHPFDELSDDDLARLARQAGMTLDELRQCAAGPHVETTCPLCGQPSTHLVSCKGCGGDAWGFDLEAAHGDDAQAQLQEQLRQALVHAPGLDAAGEQIRHAVQHAYNLGGCMVCSTCWFHTLPTQAYLSCPLHLFGEHVFGIEGALPDGLTLALLNAGHHDKDQVKQLIGEWLRSLWAHWTETWNTLPAGPEHDAIAHWRAAILHAALYAKPGEATR